MVSIIIDVGRLPDLVYCRISGRRLDVELQHLKPVLDPERQSFQNICTCSRTSKLSSNAIIRADDATEQPQVQLQLHPQHGPVESENRVGIHQQPATVTRPATEWGSARIRPAGEERRRHRRDHGQGHKLGARSHPAARRTWHDSSSWEAERSVVYLVPEANARIRFPSTQREQEHRDAIAQTLRTQRTEAARTSLAVDRLQTRNEELARQLAASQAQERAARAAARTAESATRALREEMARLKTTVAQVRTACANDVRKRDVQLQRLKSHLTAQQRGNRAGLVGASITITPGVTGMGATCVGGREEEAAPGLDDPGYSLRQETTEFLTQLSQSLSDENDRLIGLVRSTLATLREIQGLPEVANRAEEGADDSVDMAEPGSDMLHALPTSCEVLERQMDLLLDKLRSLLTNPNFVSIEEIETREEEIARLRSGWEKMESRWRQAVGMMDRWGAKMLNEGETVTVDKLEQLKTGLRLEGLGDIQDDAENGATSHMEDIETSSIEDDETGLTADSGRVNGETTAFSGDLRSKSGGDTCLFDIKLHPVEPAVEETTGNRSPRKVSFQERHDSSSVQLDESQSGMEGITASIDDTKPPSRGGGRSKGLESRLPRKVRVPNKNFEALPAMRRQSEPLDILFSIGIGSTDSFQTLKRRSSPQPHPSERSPKLTVQEKLEEVQAEAEAAATARGLEASDVKDKDQDEGPARTATSAKKTKIRGRPRRRKSTLSPEELEQLLLGS